MSVMNTYSGRKFDPMKIAPEDVYLEDIAHALSLVCRGGGQIRWFYSVGQHSINCAHEALARGWSDRMALACLLHDASECYISDVIRPVKVHLQNYLEIESMIMDAIWEKFHLDDLTDEENQKWKQIDNEILELELKTLMKGEKDREIIPLSSTPDLSERTFSSVEKEFKELALELFQKLLNFVQNFVSPAAHYLPYNTEDDSPSRLYNFTASSICGLPVPGAPAVTRMYSTPSISAKLARQ